MEYSMKKTGSSGRKVFVTLLIIAGIIVLIVGGLTLSAMKRAKNNAEDLETYKIIKGDLSLFAVGSGKVSSSEIRTILPQGSVTEMLVAVGDEVKVGDILAKYVDLTGTKKDLLSTFDGIVTGVPSSANLAAGKPATSEFQISNKEKLQLVISLTERDIYKVSKGQKASVFISALNKSFDGEVSHISYAGDTTKDFTIYTVSVSIPDAADKDLHLGMSASAKIAISEKKDVYKVPPEAIIEDGNERYLLSAEWKKNPLKPQEDYYIKVTTGLSDTDYAEVIGENLEGKEIVILPDDNMRFPSFFRQSGRS